MLSAEVIAHALNGRRSGKRWMIHCPAHQDKTPSCSISEDGSGKILVHCFSGCPQQDVIEALRQKGLWPEKQERFWSPEEKKVWGKRRRKAERLAKQAQYWYRARLDNLQREKLQASTCFENGQIEWRWSWIELSRKLHELLSAGPDSRLRYFIEEHRKSPHQTSALVRQGREMESEDLSFGALIVAMLAIGDPQPHAH